MSSGDPKYFPALCSAAHRPFLALLVGPNGQPLSPRCPSCGAPGRVIAGAHYLAEERERFERVVDIIQGHRIPADHAGAALAALEGLLRKPEADVRRGLLAVWNAETIVPFDAFEHEELIEFVSLLSGLLSVQAQAAAVARALGGAAAERAPPKA